MEDLKKQLDILIDKAEEQKLKNRRIFVFACCHREL